jgi:GT2 family glycosyltransferase
MDNVGGAVGSLLKHHLAQEAADRLGTAHDEVIVSVGIKALNEEAHIDAALTSALAAIAGIGGEVILADSGSTDRTIEIAQRHPVRIVQLADVNERSCGAGAQLAFQEAQGRYFYILDGDMVLDPDFLAAGIAYLEAHPEVAAVGGIVTECNVAGEEFQIRSKTTRSGRSWQAGIVDRLDCGGLFRTSAVRDAGYFADRNLHAFEEFELAARLASRGWKLARIDVPAVDHFGHVANGYSLLWRRIRSGYSGAPGEVLRGALGKRHLPIVLARLGHIRNGMAIILWWLALTASLTVLHSFILACFLVAAPLGFLTMRRGSARLGIYSFVAWNVSAIGLVTGLLRRRISPDQPLASIDLTPGKPARVSLD